MVSGIFQTLGQIVSAFAALVVDLFEAVVSIFYTAGTGSDPGSLTIVGTLALIGAGVGLVLWAFRYIRGLIKVKAKQSKINFLEVGGLV